MPNPINYFLDKITVYRLMVYLLRGMITWAMVLGFFGIIPFSPTGIIVNAAFLVSVCYLSNKFFSILFKAPTNIESYNITALILTLIITPSLTPNHLLFLAIAGTIAMGSKFVFAVNKKHIFNPAAIAIVITALTVGGGASWWVGDLPMLPAVLIGGLLIVKKIQRFDMVSVFLASATIAVLIFDFQNNINPATNLDVIFLHSPLLFFAAVMFTEHFTTPQATRKRLIYAVFIGMLFYPQISFGNFYMTPELALVIGNIAAYFLSPKYKFALSLRSKTQIAENIFDFSFPKPSNFNFIPGQYMEWTLPHDRADFRGNRRYFTIASSPTEDVIRLGVKFDPKGSSFKRKLQNLTSEDKVVATQLSGDFILPFGFAQGKPSNKKLVFIAGGIGITPFRSMIKYLLDKNQKSNITLVYSNKNASDIVYKDIFDKAEEEIGLKNIYTLTDEENLPEGWKGERGRVSAEMIGKIPNYKEAIYFLSGPHSLVSSFEKVLRGMGIPRRRIKKDFFPGYV